MIEIRPHAITGEPIIHAPDRAARPNDFLQGAAASCPFCPGHEDETPPETFRSGSPWRVRAFPNKYPFAPFHEVIVESPDHTASFETIAHQEDVLSAYASRYEAAWRVPDVRHVVLFKNQGRLAGASLEHLHAQIAGIAFVPPRIEREAAAFRAARSCPLCAVDAAGNVVARNDDFVCVAPSAAPFGGELWIVPRRHVGDFGALSIEERTSLAQLLGEVSASIARRWNDQNWLFITFPNEPAAHFYVEMIPRTTAVAGFELATGTFIDVVNR